ncbi:hypothetical protein [Streptomyces sp. KL116D]|uniref:hypothetical protein n=1 Tax=Streptomyces sp. KL116D TaxID=3045152 RepID=UPI003556295C
MDNSPGRWDFQNHTHDLHTPAAASGPDGETGSLLINRRYLALHRAAGVAGALRQRGARGPRHVP